MNVNEGDVLLISYNGYKSKELRITNQTALTISLPQSAINFDEILKPGSTSQKKEIKGSVIVVKPKDPVAIPPATDEKMLQGRVAGLAVVTCVEPGVPAYIRLHGAENFRDVKPLYIIDGIEGNIDTLHPYEIESLRVLKETGAYSIYGARGANGVIVITTRKPNPCKSMLPYDFYSGVSTPLNKDLNLPSPQVKKKSE
jgi:TonB-dependent SusC/RagA subfamily outer membrane receptor